MINKELVEKKLQQCKSTVDQEAGAGDPLAGIR
jgi:hypothetical protein